MPGFSLARTVDAPLAVFVRCHSCEEMDFEKNNRIKSKNFSISKKNNLTLIYELYLKLTNPLRKSSASKKQPSPSNSTKIPYLCKKAPRPLFTAK
jgi:hypothetical protein